MSLRLHFFIELHCAFTTLGLSEMFCLFSCLIKGVKEIVLAASTLKIAWVSTDDLASFTLRELSHVHPNLITLTELTIIQVRSFSCFLRFTLRFIFNWGQYFGKLSSKAFVTSFDSWVLLKTRVEQPEASRALLGDQGCFKWSQAMTVRTPHLTFLSEYVPRLYCVLAEETCEWHDITHASATVTWCAFSTLPVELSKIEVALLMAVYTSLLCVCALQSARYTAWSLVAVILPLCNWFATDAEVAVGFW